MSLQHAVKIIVMASAFLSPALMAAPTNFSYSHIEMSAKQASFDGLPDLLGVGLSSRHRLGNDTFIQGGITYLEGDDWHLDAEASGLQGAMGYTTGVLTHADLVLMAGLDYQRNTLCGYVACNRESDTGALGAIILRAWVSDSVALAAGVQHVTTGSGSTDLSLEAAGWFDFNSSLFVALDWASDRRMISTGYRYTF